MGTNCAPLLADLFLYSYESEFLQTICRRSWYIAAHVWKIYDFKIEVVPLIINFSTELTTVVKYQDLVEIYSVSAEKIISDAFSYSENA
jgi:hypothetical protein